MLHELKRAWQNPPCGYGRIGISGRAAAGDAKGEVMEKSSISWTEMLCSGEVLTFPDKQAAENFIAAAKENGQPLPHWSRRCWPGGSAGLPRQTEQARPCAAVSPTMQQALINHYPGWPNASGMLNRKHAGASLRTPRFKEPSRLPAGVESQGLGVRHIYASSKQPGGVNQ